MCIRDSALVDLAADLGRLVAAELAGLFLDLAFGLVPLAFQLVVHCKYLLDLTRAVGRSNTAQIWCHTRLVFMQRMTGVYRPRVI